MISVIQAKGKRQGCLSSRSFLAVISGQGLEHAAAHIIEKKRLGKKKRERERKREGGKEGREGRRERGKGELLRILGMIHIKLYSSQ